MKACGQRRGRGIGLISLGGALGGRDLRVERDGKKKEANVIRAVLHFFGEMVLGARNPDARKARW